MPRRIDNSLCRIRHVAEPSCRAAISRIPFRVSAWVWQTVPDCDLCSACYNEILWKIRHNPNMKREFLLTIIVLSAGSGAVCHVLPV